MTTRIQILGKGWCPHTKAAWKLPNTKDYEYEQVDCAQADNAKTCELAQGYPTFVVKGKRCTAGMYPQGTLDKKFEACVAGKYPEEKNNGTMPMCNGAV